MAIALATQASRSRRWLRRAGTAAAALAASWVVAVAALWWAQEAVIFRPLTLPAEHRFGVAADVHETWVDVPGARLNALHLKLPNPDGVVFFLHGNGGNLDGWFPNPTLYREANVDLFMLDYRGYGKSSGRIDSQQQLLDDVRAAWRQVAPAYAGKRRIVLGRSLGSGLAAQLAAEVQPELTLLVAPFSSLQQLAAESYPWVPGALLRYPLRSDLALPRIAGPLLIVHGEHDTVIPASHARALHAAAPRSRLLIVPGAGHADVHRFDDYRRIVGAALAGR